MTIQLPTDLESSIQAAVDGGRYASVDDAMAEAARLLLRQIDQDRLEPKTSTDPSPDLTVEEIADQELQRRLLEAGIISEIKPPPRLLPARERFSPVPITGEPISETIIRERR
jgi:Arc/MetJ-type ribon-helix-helix transcriptional regulator